MPDDLTDENAEATPEEELEPTAEAVPESESETEGEGEAETQPAVVEGGELAETGFPTEDDQELEGQILDVGPPEPGNNLDLLLDIGLQVTVELGRKEMKFAEILELGKGAIVELNKLADEPVDVYVNQSKVAEGEVVVVDEHFGVRITNLLDKEALRKNS